MSSGGDVEARRRETLESFAFRVNQRRANGQQMQTASPSSSTTTAIPTFPPQQSRDATARSRYFQSNSSNGTVLVPNSSPLARDSANNSYQPYQYASGVSSIPGFNYHNSWSQGFGSRADPLSRPSGFVSSTDNAQNIANGRISPPRRRAFDDVDGVDNEPPRKRVHYEQASPGPLTAMSPGSPSSPMVGRLAHRRPLPAEAVDLNSSPHSSNDSASDAGPSTSRIIRGERPKQEIKDDTALTRFILINPTSPIDKVKAAYYKCNGDVKVATHLLMDSIFESEWRTIASSKVSIPTSQRVVGKVKEVEEEREAARAAAKERAAKSSIYKRRADLENGSIASSIPPASTLAAEIFSSPIAPCRPPRGKVRKHVVDSGSEVDLDDDDDDDDEVVMVRKRTQGEDYFERKALESMNAFGPDALRELTGCTPEQAAKIISLRPFGSVEDLQQRLGQGRKKAGPSGISPRMFQDCVEIYEGYGSVDEVLLECERIGNDLKKAIAAWSGAGKGKGKEKLGSMTSRSPSVLADDIVEDGALNLVSMPIAASTSTSNGSMVQAPSLLSPGVQLKDYQLTGVNWLNLLYSKGLSCILADEMGLGKTIQVISFFAFLKELGCKGPHLIVVPSSTLENWCREFERFAPCIAVQAYYAGKEERQRLREDLLSKQPGRLKNDAGKGWEVLITTYNLAVGDERDRKFLRRINWITCVFDEGHILKNFQSQRYIALTRIDAKWKLLLTGTPLQNNLQELVSLMNFILPDQFEEAMESLRAIFKVKGDSKVSLLAEERVSRAKRMLTPFVLRRRKDQVLKDLPKRTERIEWCEMTQLQKSIYNDARQRSRKTIYDLEQDGLVGSGPNGEVHGNAQQKKGRSNPRAKEKMYLENSSNVLMDLRKAALHPMLFRTQFTDQKLTTITRLLLKEPDFKKRGAIFQYVKEDMEVMTDAELQVFCNTYKSTQKFLLDESFYLQAGKISVLLSLLERYSLEGRRCLVFSQFTQVLDIVQAIMKQKSIKYLLLTGSTAVDTRQALVDEFNENETIPIFLLSTRAGGMGINLTAASVVILFDQDFNPHNDRQAADRAYRIGQKRDVEVVKLITRGTIEEDMLRLGETKLALDEAVAGDVAEDAGMGDAEGSKGDSAAEKVMKRGLMESLRKQFEEEDKLGSSAQPPPLPTLSSAAPAVNRKGPEAESASKGGVKGATTEEAIEVDSESDSALTDLDDD